MWISKWYFEAQSRKMNDLERRVKRLELMLLEDATNKIASLQNKKIGKASSDGFLAIEEIINEKTGKRQMSRR